ncbi:ankyrin repeat domain-containing protein [Chitinibacter sp. S2-10]|uniref:ankyrin repeat domain-containing protein n=1 Tax=Chitinibacter sp. S2-10 TaxID=3373597 RepID=UPI003977553F
MSIQNDVFSHLESLIRWGSLDSIRQQEFFSILQAQPNLACDCDGDGTSLLMIAADAGNKATIETLCNFGANVDAVSAGGETALINAIRWSAEEDFDGKMRHEIVELLLESGADTNLIGFQGCSALHWAVIEGDPSTVEILLHYAGSIDSEIVDRNPMTAMALLLSGRFKGTAAQREVIAGLLDDKKARQR